MRNRLLPMFAAGLALLTLFAWRATAGDEHEQATDQDLTVSAFRVDGMTCGGCEAGVRRVVGKLDGVEDVAASYEEGTATVTYEPETVTPADIIAAIEQLGYTAELAPEKEGT